MSEGEEWEVGCLFAPSGEQVTEGDFFKLPQTWPKRTSSESWLLVEGLSRRGTHLGKERLWTWLLGLARSNLFHLATPHSGAQNVLLVKLKQRVTMSGILPLQATLTSVLGVYQEWAPGGGKAGLMQPELLECRKVRWRCFWRLPDGHMP